MAKNINTSRPVVRKQWSDKQMTDAISSVQNDHLSGNRAADLHGVPRSTLKDRLSGRVQHGVNLVSRSQTSIFSAGRYRLQYKRPH